MVAAVAGLLIARAQPAQFETNARFVIAPAAEIEDGRDIVQTIDALANRRAIVSTFGQVVLSERTFRAAASGAGLTPSQADQTHVSAVVLPEANVVEVTLRAPRPDLAESTILILGAESTRYFEDLYKVYAIQTLDIGSLKAQQVAPQPALSAVVAGVLGTSLAFLLGLAGDRLRSTRPSAQPWTRRRTPPVPARRETDGTADSSDGAFPRALERSGPPALGPGPDTSDSRPAGGSDHSQPGQGLAVSSRLDRYPDRAPSSHDILDDPDSWLSDMHQLGREVSGWSHGPLTARQQADDNRRWRAELDDLGRLLSRWAVDDMNARGGDERPDPPTPA